MVIEIPFSITLRGRKADRNLPQRTLLDALQVVQDEILAYFNDMDLREAELGDILETDNYSVVVDKKRRVWATNGRSAFRLQVFLKWRFEEAANVGRIREHLAEFFAALQAITRFDADRLLEELVALDDAAVFSQADQGWRIEADIPDPWLETYKPNIRARTTERTLAPLYKLPQNVIREISSYVGTRRRESAPRLRPLPAALQNTAIREAGRIKSSKGEPEVRAASPVRNETRKKPRSWLKRLFTRKRQNE